MQSVILDNIVKLGGKILSNCEFYFPHYQFTIYHYENCIEANDWIAYPIDNPDLDMSLLIIAPNMLPNLKETLITYFEIKNDRIPSLHLSNIS